MMTDPEAPLRQLLVPEHLWEPVTAWLRTRNFEAARLPEELLSGEELPTYVLIPSDCLAAPQEEAAAGAYAQTFDTPPSDEAAVYMRDRLIGRGPGTDMPPGQDA